MKGKYTHYVCSRHKVSKVHAAGHCVHGCRSTLICFSLGVVNICLNKSILLLQKNFKLTEIILERMLFCTKLVSLYGSEKGWKALSKCLHLNFLN